MALGKYPHYHKRSQLKTTSEGVAPSYLIPIYRRLRTEWETRHDEIASELQTGSMSEFRHWVQALVEATHDVENGMAPSEVTLPGLTLLLDEFGPSARKLYTAMFAISCWEIELRAHASRRQLLQEAKMAGITARALAELLRRAEPAWRLLEEPRTPPVTLPDVLEEGPVEQVEVTAMLKVPGIQALKAELSEALRLRLNQVERECLLRRLGVDPEDVKLYPVTRDDFAWAIVEFFARSERLPELWSEVAQQRPGALREPNPFRSWP